MYYQMYLNLMNIWYMYLMYLSLGTLKVQKVVLHKLGIIFFDLVKIIQILNYESDVYSLCDIFKSKLSLSLLLSHSLSFSFYLFRHLCLCFLSVILSEGTVIVTTQPNFQPCVVYMVIGLIHQHQPHRNF